MTEYTVNSKYMKKVTLKSLHNIEKMSKPLLNSHFCLVGEFLSQT